MIDPREPTTALRAVDVTRVFRTPAGEVRAVDGVSLTLAPGELLVLRGPSGSGKTTLLNLLAGLDRPTSGRVHVGGVDLAGLDEAALVELRRTQVGYVFQSFGLIPMLSAAENVEIPLRLLRTDPGERDDRVAEALEQVGLAGQAEQRPYELSGGQQQRVGLARALVAQPSILVADEPTGQLDSATAATVMDLILDVVRVRQVAAIVSTHDPRLIDRADAVLQLRDGRAEHPTYVSRHAADPTPAAPMNMPPDREGRAAGDGARALQE